MKNKRFFINIKGRRFWLLSLLCIVAMFMAYCGLDSLTIVSQPTTATAGQNITITLQAHDTATEVPATVQLVVGMLVPTSWHADAPGNTTVTFTSPYPGFSGPQPMHLIPSTVLVDGYTVNWPTYMMEQAGLGGNLLPNMQWVAFWSSPATDSLYTVATGTGYNPVIITIHTKVGAQNTLVKLGYFVSNTGEDLTSKQIGSQYSVALGTDCFSVTGGTDPLQDFCDKQLATITPNQMLDNDIVTIGVDLNVVSTALNNVSQLYLCDTAYTTTGQAIPNCGQTAASQFTSLGGLKWQFQFWPRKYFNLKPGQSLDHINYYLTDATGKIKVGFNSTTNPTTPNLTPFTLQFGCSNN